MPLQIPCQRRSVRAGFHSKLNVFRAFSQCPPARAFRPASPARLPRCRFPQTAAVSARCGEHALPLSSSPGQGPHTLARLQTSIRSQT
jgi:hypothetical protein